MTPASLLSHAASRRTFARAAFIVAVGACAGCSTTTATHSSASPKSRPVATDSCSVITRSEASRALGHAVKAPVRGRATVEGGVACVFYGPSVPAGADPDVPVSDSVRVVLITGAKAKPFFDDYRTKVRAQPVPGLGLGLGDQAYYDGYASLSALKGDAYVRIAAVGVRNVLGAEKELATEAVHRI